MSGAMATSRSLLLLLVLFAVVAHGSVACHSPQPPHGGGGCNSTGSCGCQQGQCGSGNSTGHGGCQSGCPCSCSACQGGCQSGCPCSCSACQGGCQSGCPCSGSSSQGGCQSGCPCSCSACQGGCQSGCPCSGSSSQGGCQSGCPCSCSACQGGCQSGCPCSCSACQGGCQSGCSCSSCSAGHNPPCNNTQPPQSSPPQHQPYPPQHQPHPPQHQPYPPQHQPYPPYVPAPRPCPIDALKLNLCVDVLGGLIYPLIRQEARAKCCPLLQGLADQDAALCLCTTIQARMLNTNRYLPAAMNLLVDCGKQLPHGFQCPAPLHAAAAATTTTTKKVGRHLQLGG